MTKENTTKCPEDVYESYLSFNEALEYKERFIELFRIGRLHQLAQKILSGRKRKLGGKLTGDLSADRVVQDLAVEFLRPVKGQGIEKKSDLHRFRLYNPGKGTKFETYIYQCMSNLVITLIDKYNRNPEPVSYDNIIGSENEENPFLNIIAVENLDLDPSLVESAIREFQKTIEDKLEKFVFEKLLEGLGKTKKGIPKEFKPKDFCQKAEEAGRIKNGKRMYTRILKCRRELLEKFKEFLEKSDLFV